MNPSKVFEVLPYAVHAATCLKTKAVIITNDKHFEKIGKIEVWKIEKAIRELLQKE